MHLWVVCLWLEGNLVIISYTVFINSKDKLFANSNNFDIGSKFSILPQNS